MTPLIHELLAQIDLLYVRELNALLDRSRDWPASVRQMAIARMRGALERDRQPLLDMLVRLEAKEPPRPLRVPVNEW